MKLDTSMETAAVPTFDQDLFEILIDHDYERCARDLVDVIASVASVTGDRYWLALRSCGRYVCVIFDDGAVRAFEGSHLRDVVNHIPEPHRMAIVDQLPPASRKQAIVS